MRPTRRVIAIIAAIPLFVVGSRITLPGVNAAKLLQFTRPGGGGGGGGLLGLYELVFQGGLHRGAILALGIMPYLSARIFFRLWRVVKPDAHATKLKTRLMTVALSVIQSVGLATALQRIPGVVANPGPVSSRQLY